jgi:hypothetical protein
VTRPSEDDLGAPIDELAELRAPTSGGFLGKVRDRIDRRVLAFSLLDLTWSGLGLVLLEFVEMIVGIFGGNRTDRGGTQPWNKKD